MKSKKKNIKRKMLFTIISSVLTVMIICMIILSVFVINIEKRNMTKMAEDIGYRYSQNIERKMDYSMQLAKDNADKILVMIKENKQDRNLVIKYLKTTVQSNQDIFGSWVVFEPDVFDKKDHLYKNTAGNSQTGRFIPYWNILGGLHLENCIDFDREDENGLYYSYPKKKLIPFITEPTVYLINNINKMVVSMCYPIIYNRKFIGVSGTDLSIEKFQELSSKIKPFEDGYVSIISGKGKYVSHPNQQKINKYFYDVDIFSGIGEDTPEKINDKIKSGIFYSVEKRSGTVDNKVIRFYVPILIDKTQQPWSFVISIPVQKFFESSYKILYLIILFFLLIMFILVIITGVISAEITKPLNKLSTTVKEFHNGNYSVSFKIDSDDEIGELSDFIDEMTLSLSASNEEFKSINEELTETYDEIEKKNNELKKQNYYFSKQLSRIAEHYDDITGKHIDRVSVFSGLIAGKLKLEPSMIEDIIHYSPLHDIGKLRVSKDILRKPGLLSETEFEEIKKHPVYGAEIIGDTAEFQIARNIALYHHEKYNGTGYPYGLKENEIPIEAQIVSFADVYDALRSKRAYKSGYSHEETVKIILDGDSRLKPDDFNPKIIQVFKEYANEFDKIYSEMD